MYIILIMLITVLTAIIVLNKLPRGKVLGGSETKHKDNELPRGRASRYRVTQKTTVADFC